MTLAPRPFHQKTKPFITMAAVVSAILGVAGMAVSSGAQVIDTRYLHSVEFADFRAMLALQHARDSLIFSARFSALDSQIGQLIRECQRHGGCR